MSQTTYNFNPAVGVEGMLAEIREGQVVISKVASGAVPVGKLAAPGTDAQQGPPPTTADPNSTNPGQIVAFPVSTPASPVPDADFIGVPMYDSSRPPFDNTNSYSDKDPVPTLRKGVIWVKPMLNPTTPEVVAQYADVYVWTNPTAPGVTDPIAGTFASGAHGGKAVLMPRNWRYLTTSTSGQPLTVLEIW